MKISELLRKTADENLASVRQGCYDYHTQSDYICHALALAQFGPYLTREKVLASEKTEAYKYLRKLGMNMSGGGFVKVCADDPWSARLTDYEQQSARFMWLHFAAEVAESEGL